MQTRSMSNSNQELISKMEELENLIEQQRLQLERLQRENTGPSSALQLASPPVTSARFDPSRVPDAIKMIVPYNGNPKLLSSWISSVESKLNFSKQLCPTPEDEADALPLWYSIIRDKIVDKANDALLQNSTPCEWAAIKSLLKNRFGDKRDLSTILNKLPYLQQKTRSVEEFYAECDEILSDVRAKVIADDDLKPCANNIIDTYETMITTAFIDGLHDPISALTRTSKPTTLYSAYQHALEQDSAAKRQTERRKLNQKPLGTIQRPVPFQSQPTPNGRWNQFPPSSNRFYQNQSFGQRTMPSNSNPAQRPNYYQTNSQYQNQNPSPFQSKNYSPNSQPQIKKEPPSQTNVRRFIPSNQVHFQEHELQTEEVSDETFEYQNSQEPPEDVCPTDDEVNFPLDPNQVTNE